MDPASCPRCKVVLPRSSSSEASVCPECGTAVPTTEPAGSSGDLPTGRRSAAAPPPARSAGATRRTTPADAISDTALDPMVGKTLGGCRIGRLVGRGAMGNVYEARQLSLDRVVALKTIRSELCADGRVLARFQQEARTVGRFRTEHIVQVHDVGFDQGIHFLVMEFVGGGHLGQHVRSLPGKRLPADEALRFLLEASRGLLEAERLGVLHRDIKPGNLLLDDRGRLKIADFGISKVLGSAVQQTLPGNTGFLGTPLYMSPEQARGERLDCRTDMYSLGATFYHLITGHRPVDGDSVYEVIRRKSETPCLSLRPLVEAGEVPADLGRVIERMTSLRPEDRHESFRDVILDIDRVTARSGTPSGARSGTRARKAALAAGVVAAAAICAALALTVRPGAASALREPAGALDRPGAEPDSASPAETPGSALLPAAVGGGEEAPDPRPPSEPYGLAATSPPGRVVPTVESSPGPDPAAALDGLRTRLRADGPSPNLSREARLAAEAAAREGNPLVRTAIEALERDVDEWRRRAAVLEALRAPRALDPPFEEAEGYWEGLRGVFDVPADAGGELREWLESERHGRAAALARDLGAAAGTLLGRVSAERERFQRWEATADEIASLADLVARSREAISRVLPDGVVPRIPESLASDLRADAERRRDVESRARTLEASVEALERRASGAKDLAEWERELSAGIQDSIAAARAELDSIVRAEPSAPLSTARERLSSAESSVAAWAARTSLRAEALAALAARDLSRATAAAADLRRHGRSTSVADALATCIAELQAGFQCALESLDPPAAVDHFSAAATRISELAPSSETEGWVRSTVDRANRLVRSTVDMAPVRRGDVVLPPNAGGRRVSVEPFFIDRYEVSVRQWREFAARWAAARTFEEVRSLWRDEATWERYGRDDRLRPPYFAEVAALDPSWPVEEVNYHQAEAYLRQAGKGLPTLAEWFLAARGAAVGGKPAFDEVSRDANWRAERPKRVADSAAARAFPERHSVHHLAGNVAEWCKAAPEDPAKAEIVGGRYLDSKQRYLTGELRDSLPLGTSLRGCGFRGVLRPRELFADLLPRQAGS